MKSLMIMFVSVVVMLSLSGCGGDSTDMTEESTLQEDSVKVLSTPGPFTEGDFGEIKLSRDYDAVKADLKDATLIDIRTAWEQDRYGYPEGFINIAYQNRDYQEDGHYNVKPINPTFVEDVSTAVAGDLHQKIVLICDSSSRSGAHSDKSKDSAAKLLSEKGFTNVYHIFGGFRGNESGSYENGWKSYNLPLGK